MQSGRKYLIVVGLVLANVGSALFVVYGSHMNRKLHMALQKQQIELDSLNMEWGQLQLEQSTYATHNKIEQTARLQLDMRMPLMTDVERIRQ